MMPIVESLVGRNSSAGFTLVESFAIVLASVVTLRMAASRSVESRSSSATMPARTSAMAKLVSSPEYLVLAEEITNIQSQPAMNQMPAS
ncbi:hypothetical protein QQX98_012463 [Neonectria punicea]|uniref:Type II secretion system protein n=1 Tax=Neonectria punicea TaxID=979145 RepID=A0ABR1GJ58_9HYPO